ncbi:MAG: hypothetical protein QOI80_1310 [Solirubrobacteraceae bacterium]|jgi:hypothetical protein|nr:hypothetical protein [Solirubrobacteraceae bacterium]
MAGGRTLIRRALALALAAGLATAGSAAASTNYGALTFPEDESAQPVSWDYWWGAASVVAKSGNRYVVEMAYTAQDAVISSSYIVYPLQGRYRGQAITTMDGPREWGHPDQPAGRFVHTMTFGVPGATPRLKLDTLDAGDGAKLIDRWARTRLDRNTYRLRVNQSQAYIHPAAERAGLHMDLRASMYSTPLLAGGTGRWFYGVPEDFDIPSRGYQYMQGARKLRGTLRVPRAHGKSIKETVDPARSILLMAHESDPPEDIPVALGVAASTQVHLRYFQSYNLQWPWELVFADLGNGAQLMFDLQAYHDTPRGLVSPLGLPQPAYRVLATLRLPSGESVPLDGAMHAEHLSYRRLDDGIASVTGTTLSSPWVEGWRMRVSYPGGTVNGVHVPAFDLGLIPPFKKSEPLGDAQNRRLTQRVPFDVEGWYDGCPVRGFAWSEMLVNWYGWEDRDPWFTGGDLPRVPRRCGAPVPPPPTGTAGVLTPPREPTELPDLGAEQCGASFPDTPRCEYDPKHMGGIAGQGPDPGGWTVTVTGPDRPVPLKINGHGGYEAYACGTVRPGDHVVATATREGSSVTVGDPLICY